MDWIPFNVFEFYLFIDSFIFLYIISKLKYHKRITTAKNPSQNLNRSKIEKNWFSFFVARKNGRHRWKKLRKQKVSVFVLLLSLLLILDERTHVHKLLRLIFQFKFSLVFFFRHLVFIKNGQVFAHVFQLDPDKIIDYRFYILITIFNRLICIKIGLIDFMNNETNLNDFMEWMQARVTCT